MAYVNNLAVCWVLIVGSCICATEAGYPPADVCFILDSSGSVGHDNWDATLQFVMTVVRQLSISQGLHRVAVLSIANKANVNFLLNSYNNVDDITDKIQTLPFKEQKTNTSGALRVARTTVFQADNGDRPAAQNYAVIVTDGISTVEKNLTISEAGKMKENGTCLILIGIGAKINKDQLSAMARDSVTESRYVYQVMTYGNLDEIADSVLAILRGMEVVFGPSGATGATGDTGPPGRTGPTGQAGVTGEVGPTGPKKGISGDVGTPGPSGGTGPAGDPGRGGVPGESGTGGFLGPSGPPGAKGDAGDSIRGQAGPTGVAGVVGLEGFNGSQGDRGPAGVRGVPGIRVGPNGTLGPQGPTGAEGVQGPTGIPGINGTGGVQGLVGLEGLPGKVGPLDIDENPCGSNSSRCGHFCINDHTGYRCACFEGFSLTDDGHSCQDVDECSVNNGGCEQLCLNTNGSYICACRKGFTLSKDTKTCLDVDECCSDYFLPPCSRYEACLNTRGGHYCLPDDMVYFPGTSRRPGSPKKKSALLKRRTFLLLFIWSGALSLLFLVSFSLLITTGDPATNAVRSRRRRQARDGPTSPVNTSIPDPPPPNAPSEVTSLLRPERKPSAVPQFLYPRMSLLSATSAPSAPPWEPTAATPYVPRGVRASTLLHEEVFNPVTSTTVPIPRVNVHDATPQKGHVLIGHY